MLIIRPAGMRGGVDTLTMQFEVGSTELGYDIVYIYAPEDAVDPLHVFSGTFRGEVVTTQETSVKIHFFSDHANSLDGFQARYAVLEGPTPAPTVALTPVPTPVPP
eukprot:Sspe_Gene.92919::Locus_65668_Transcript_1_1_Confidence_1.000_Length_892::g.92919::m.92919